MKRLLARLVYGKKSPSGAFSDVPSFPLAKGATFASWRIGRVKPP
jgi:hypothetical protein